MPRALMFCSLCQKWDTKGRNGSVVWNKIGCETIRLDKVNAHELSKMHEDSIHLEKNELSTIDETLGKLQKSEMTALIDAQKVLYFLIKHHLPHMTLFKPLVNLCVELGAKNLANLSQAKNATYTSHVIIQDFIDSQSDIVEEKIQAKMRSSESYGLMLDEYTDVATRKHLAFAGRYIEEGESKLAFLRDVEIPNGTANTIVENIKDYLHDADLDKSKMTCFASDGPAVMTGKKNGVVAQLKKENPSLIDIHCINHRMQLAVSSAFKSVTSIENVEELLMGLFK
ncbi:zinc finger protein 862-like [Haliotis rubra]|uniref:zinc finger protein 862-like n=1 Tax=Haliotis rubra TaxID=36100 RepID=UPI001EE5E378|nr:zinc finger protein 862-like [Haliotis rubra]